MYKIMGFIGMAIILISFLMNQIHKWKTDSFTYDFLNFIGAFLLMIYAFSIRSYPFLLLNLVWALFSLKDSFMDLKPKKKRKKR